MTRSRMSTPPSGYSLAYLLHARRWLPARSRCLSLGVPQQRLVRDLDHEKHMAVQQARFQPWRR